MGCFIGLTCGVVHHLNATLVPRSLHDAISGGVCQNDMCHYMLQMFSSLQDLRKLGVVHK